MMKKKKEIMASVRMPRTHQFFHLKITHIHTSLFNCKVRDEWNLFKAGVLMDVEDLFKKSFA